MKALQIEGTEGTKSLRLVDTTRPDPGPTEVLIGVKASGINFAELEQTRGRYPLFKPLPFVMGFEAAGTVAAIGSLVTNVAVGDRVAALVSSGGFAEYAIAQASSAIPIPNGVTFSEATTLTVQGLSAYAILKLAAKAQPSESVLIQAAAGGVGLFLVQLAKILGMKQIIALASSDDKLEIVKTLGADVAIDYTRAGWTDQVLEATGGQGVDLVLQSVSGEIAEKSIKLIAPFGRIVVYGAGNVYDTIYPEQLALLIHNNQSLIGFNIPTQRPEQLGQCMGELLELVSSGVLKLFAGTAYRLDQFADAFEALSSRRTIGKVVLLP